MCIAGQGVDEFEHGLSGLDSGVDNIMWPQTQATIHLRDARFGDSTNVGCEHTLSWEHDGSDGYDHMGYSCNYEVLVKTFHTR